jgi:hypothetical protein
MNRKSRFHNAKKIKKRIGCLTAMIRALQPYVAITLKGHDILHIAFGFVARGGKIAIVVRNIEVHYSSIKM